MSKKWPKCQSQRDVISGHNDNNKSFDNNNQNKYNDKTVDDPIEPSIDGSDLTTSPSNGRNPCKVCNNEDSSTQFFASGPFYAIETMAHNKNNSGASRERCNVLYAEMPHIFNNDIDVNKTQAISREDNGKQTNEERQHFHNVWDKHLRDNYQLFCYNCCSPLSLSEESQIDHKLHHLSTNDSNCEHKPIDCEIDNSSSSLSSPIMLKFCQENGQTLCDESNTDEVNPSTNHTQNYTTVIKPKAVRPKTAVTFDEMSSHSLHSTLPTIFFHGSENVLTDRDESAFTQIPRRRSNSEATHHYQSVLDRNDMPSNSCGYSRPLERYGHQRSKSVNKTFVNTNNGFIKFGSMNDKHFTKKDIESNGIGFNRYAKRNEFNSTKLLTSTQMQSSEPIHMSLEEVKSIFNKNQTKSLKSGLFIAKTKRNSSDIEDKSHFNKSRSKSKIKSAFEHFFRHKRRSDSERQTEEYCSKEFRQINNESSQESASPFTHRALPPLPRNPIKDINKSDETIDTNEQIESLEETNSNSNEVLSKEEEDRRQKFLDYAASIERVKDCGWYWGPISGEMAEKLLATEPCGSFIVRDSSDEHYIFSLTFKLNGMVRHVRIEHDQGNFSFGSLQKFRSNTIVDFIENAVEHSRSGRFLFFLHRRPVMGPMRVQLLHPVSRFKQIQSLQHMCRFIILKHVRRDLIKELPLPQMLKKYLNTPYYYSEELALMNRDESKAETKPDHI